MQSIIKMQGWRSTGGKVTRLVPLAVSRSWTTWSDTKFYSLSKTTPESWKSELETGFPGVKARAGPMGQKTITFGLSLVHRVIWESSLERRKFTIKMAAMKDDGRTTFRDDLSEAAKKHWPLSLPVSAGANHCSFEFCYDIRDWPTLNIYLATQVLHL